MVWPITGASVRNHLKLKQEPDDEDDLNLYARAAMERVEEEVGRMRGQTTSFTFTGPANRITLNERFSAVEVKVGALTQPPTAFVYDPDSSTITGSFGAGVITVIGTAPATAPAVIEISCRELAGIWYRQAKAPRGSGQGANAGFTPLGFAIPREIEEKIAPYRDDKLPGIG